MFSSSLAEAAVAAAVVVVLVEVVAEDTGFHMWFVCLYG